jgi:DNA-directed RNA polymerase subunit RPC12/RpoP
MTVEFRCEKCGKLLSVQADPGGMVKCTQCGKKVQVPAGLASLPHPQIGPGDGASAGAMPPPPMPPQAGGPMPPPMAGPQGPGAPGMEPEMEEANSGAMSKMAMLMPWMISVFFHMGIFLVMLFFILMSQMHKQIFEITTPEAVYAEDSGAAADPGTIGPGTDKNIQGGKKEFSRMANMGSIGDSADTNKTMSVFGQSSNGAAGSSGFGPLGGGGGGGGRVRFLGGGGEEHGTVHHLVFVIDRSGSMVDSFDYLKNAMVDTISKLSDIQDFDIIMFSEGHPAYMEMGAKSLVPATQANKEVAGKFMEGVNAQGSTLAADAIRRGFDVLAKAGDKPGKLMILLTDACFDDAANVLQAIKERNSDKKVLVSTYLYAVNEEKDGKEIMEKIAKENGGKYKFFSTKEAN